MAFSHKHRFLKKFNISYYVKLNLEQISELSKIPLDELRSVYDAEYEIVKKQTPALNKVYSYANKLLDRINGVN